MGSEALVDADVEIIARQVAIAQIVAGLCNVFVIAPLAYIGYAILCGVPTLGMCGLCGLVGLLFVPIGFLEIFLGALVATDPVQFLPISRKVAMFEAVLLIFGSPASFLAGLLVLALTGRDEVQPLLNG